MPPRAAKRRAPPSPSTSDSSTSGDGSTSDCSAFWAKGKGKGKDGKGKKGKGNGKDSKGKDKTNKGKGKRGVKTNDSIPYTNPGPDNLVGNFQMIIPGWEPDWGEPDWSLLFDPYASYYREMYNSRAAMRRFMHPSYWWR